ncbi:hypothetical protein AVEN_85495-1 [Araneus ventricosus]|uniref:Uncharacterized protein n=1 Tax=Araneus ventricosus TaxID=182803 RepID=A0A4Y2GU13_ARAVE|nr:hypothetical protein AVEN_85495-1 [Araneus ventricosus]
MFARRKHDFWSLPRSWGSADLWKDKVDAPSSFTVVPFILSELGGNGMKFLLRESLGCWILCWDPFQGSCLCWEIRCLVTRMFHMSFNPVEMNISRVEEDAFNILCKWTVSFKRGDGVEDGFAVSPDFNGLVGLTIPCAGFLDDN